MGAVDHAAVGSHLRLLFEAGTVTGVSDRHLLERFVSRRDELAFTALLERHGPMVQPVCHAVLGDHHDAQDAFQATFLVLVRKASSIWPRARVGPWLYGVAYRTALKARSSMARRYRAELSAGSEDPVGWKADGNGQDEARKREYDIHGRQIAFC